MQPTFSPPTRGKTLGTCSQSVRPRPGEDLAARLCSPQPSIQGRRRTDRFISLRGRRGIRRIVGLLDPTQLAGYGRAACTRGAKSATSVLESRCKSGPRGAVRSGGISKGHAIVGACKRSRLDALAQVKSKLKIKSHYLVPSGDRLYHELLVQAVLEIWTNVRKRAGVREYPTEEIPDE